jgi:aminomethyltransferase
MGIGRHKGEIFSVASPNPAGRLQSQRALLRLRQWSTASCRVGQHVDIADGRRTITVTIVDDVRPHRTARKPMTDMV